MASRWSRPSCSTRGQYAIGLDYEVHNASNAPWAANAYAQILRNDPPTKRSMFNVDSRTPSTGRRCTMAPSTASSTPRMPRTRTWRSR